MSNLPIYSTYGGEKNIALLDNSAIAFMQQLDFRGVKADILLKDYDLILVPNWVFEEVKDSEYRRQYLEKLRGVGYPIFRVNEEKYSDFMNQEEINLYRIVNASVSRIGQLMQYLRKHVQKDDLLDLDASEDWIHAMYENWPMTGGQTPTGRQKKKNAGEISLTVLAEIFSFYYEDLQTLTIYTQDADTYDFQKKAAEKLKKEVFPSGSPISVTYKSNDFILCQLFREGKVTLEDIGEIRKDCRRVTYTQKQPDQSIDLQYKSLNNDEFLTLIQDETAQIIF